MTDTFPSYLFLALFHNCGHSNSIVWGRKRGWRHREDEYQQVGQVEIFISAQFLNESSWRIRVFVKTHENSG